MASAELQIPEHIQETQNITREELEMILHTQNPLVTEELRRRAQQTAKAIYGNKIYVRGLIEFTNYCKNNCYYCGIRCSNTDADRYRLSLEQILSCCETGWNLGFRTFVLQGGEDPHFTDEHICQIVRTIKEIYPDCAVTLSIGEKSEESYQAYFNAGADRYLLRTNILFSISAATLEFLPHRNMESITTQSNSLAMASIFICKYAVSSNASFRRSEYFFPSVQPLFFM